MTTTTSISLTVTDARVQETRELETVVARLRDRYPSVGETVIRDVVATSLHMFDDAAVRKFVPLLVEKLARQTLDRRSVIDLVHADSPDRPAG